MKKIFFALVVMLLLVGAIAACFGTSEPEEITYPAETEQPTPEETPVPAETPATTPAPAETPAPTPPPTQEPEEITLELTVEELTAFILRAEQVYRDIVLGRLFSGHWDEALGDWVWSEYVEPEWHQPGRYMLRLRVLPSSGFTTVAELNAALHEYWSEDFQVSTNSRTESIDYKEIDGGLYFFPAEISGVGASFLGVVWELAQFELMYQEGEHAILRADVYVTTYGVLYSASLQWEIANGRVIAREIEWGELVLWQDFPEAIDAMIASGRWTEAQVLHD